jgi:hypothetical protein
MVLLGEARRLRVGLIASAVLLGLPASAAALTSENTTPFPSSKVIVGARWTSPRYGPPRNQSGDILPTVWADDDNEYTMMDDGGTDVPIAGALWRQSLARITGSPPSLHFTLVGNSHSPPPHTWPQIRKDPLLAAGPIGPDYSSGLVEANNIFYATQEQNWSWGQNGPFAGLEGVAYSTNHGVSWTSVNKPFPAPLGNLNWVIRGRGGVYNDGYVYAIATEREFNATNLILGRAQPGVATMTDPAQWQWQTGWVNAANTWPEFTSNVAAAIPVISWPSHITYPQMAYDSPLRRYLLTFTYSYAQTVPGVWRNGAELVILEAPHPWGPFSFVAQEANFGPSNGYGAGFPLSWMSKSGTLLWMKWAANFDGCASNLNCAGGYGFNYRQMRLVLAGHH